MKTRACFIHALSSLHAGVGQAAELIDLPIARLKGSNIPFLPGSSIKGVLRDAAREVVNGEKVENDKLLAIFGPDTDNAADHAGALVCMDARLLCLPVRSYRGVFAYVSSPLLLQLAARDLGGAPNVPSLTGNKIALSEPTKLRNGDETVVYLEDLDLTVDSVASGDTQKWAQLLGRAIPSVFESRFAIVSDELMAFLWETATQVDTRIRIDRKTRTAAGGQLWIEESLPAETLLIGMLGAERVRKPGIDMSPDTVLDFVLKEERILQFGGKATVGRGRCRLLPA